MKIIKNINVKKEDVAFIVTNIGILCPIGLLIASQIKQEWISYTFVISGSTLVSPGLTVPFTSTTNADIGIWDTSFNRE